jgi:hypothetical protein
VVSVSDTADGADVRRLFKTLARVARFHGESERGLADGIKRALEIMPFFPDHCARVRGEPCTNRYLLNLAGTTSKTLARYRTEDGLSQERRTIRRTAIEILDRGVVLTEDDVAALFRERHDFPTRGT